MSEPRIKSQIWVSAQVRTCSLDTLPIVISHRGDPDAGSVIIRLDRLNGTSLVLSQSRNAEGQRVWLRVTGDDPVDNADADAYVARRLKNDPDIWVLEIEDPDERYVPDALVVS